MSVKDAAGQPLKNAPVTLVVGGKEVHATKDASGDVV